MRKTFYPAALVLSFSVLATINPALAENHMKMKNGTNGQTMMNHAAMTMPKTNYAVPTEGGQSAFAAIAEIVRLLKANPDTDWSKVNINALREHLVDMNYLTLEADAKTTIADNKVIFTVTGKGKTLRAVQTMVPAHAKVLSSTNLYEATAEKTENGVIMTITAPTEALRQEVAALGVFGIMANGAQHQPHHLQMALGTMKMN